MAKFYVSGIIQITVHAKTESEAVAKAERVAFGLEQFRKSVAVNLDNISSDDEPGKSLDEVGDEA